jgi:ATP-dependent RNA helicase RhlE
LVKDLFSSPPLRVRTRGSQQVVSTLQVDNRRVHSGRRFDTLRELLRESPEVGTLLFSNTRKQCEETAEWLDSEGIAYVSYMGQMDRQERRANLSAFRQGTVSVLLTTDLGGRGLDIERVDRVINVHLPREVNNYLHRVGRTARAGRTGLVINLVTQRDHPLLAKLRKRADRV